MDVYGFVLGISTFALIICTGLLTSHFLEIRKTLKVLLRELEVNTKELKELQEMCSKENGDKTE